jgi:hypothetical protein
MGEETKKQTSDKNVRQILFAIATILILFGLFYLVDNLSNLLNFSVSYYLWLIFQLILSLLVVFIGFKMYRIGKNFEISKAFRNPKVRNFTVLALALGLVIPSTVGLSSGGASSLFGAFPRRHDPISFGYRLIYRWNYATGASATICTLQDFSHLGVQILFDVRKIMLFRTIEWVITPYQIYDSPGAHLLMIGPATGTLELGMLSNGAYTLKIVSRDATDVFSMHKTDDEFWIQECSVTRGSLEQKSSFERSLDQYTLNYIGFPNIENNTKTYIDSRLKEIGAVFDGSDEYFDGWSVDFYFKYSGDAAKLSKIIVDVAKMQPSIMVRIQSNTGWQALTWIYNFAEDIKPQFLDTARRIILEKNLVILSEGTWGNYTQLNLSSAPLEKDRYEVRPGPVQAFLEAGLKEYDDFYVSY